MQVTHYFDASLTSPVITTIPAMQGDGIRLLVARLKEGTKPWPVPEGISAGLSYELPDRVPGYYDRLNDGTPACTINGDQVSVVLDPILTERPGPVKASIILRDPDGIQVATFPFHIWVKRVPGMVHGENLEAPAHIFDGKIYYGGPGGALLPSAWEQASEPRSWKTAVFFWWAMLWKITRRPRSCPITGWSIWCRGSRRSTQQWSPPGGINRHFSSTQMHTGSAAPI